MSNPASNAERPQGSWNSGVFLSKAKELSRRLKVWDITDFLSPIQFASQQESRQWIRLTFREIVSHTDALSASRPTGGMQLFPNEGGEPDEDGFVGVAYQNPDSDTDRSLTQWLLGDFLCHLEAAPPLPALDYLKGSFDHLLDLPAWTLVEPPTTMRVASDDPRKWMVTGRAVPPEILGVLTDAAEKLLAAAPASWCSSVGGRQQADTERCEAGTEREEPDPSSPILFTAKPRVESRLDYGPDGRLTLRCMEDAIGRGSGVIYHGIFASKIIERKEDLPSAEEYALLGIDPLTDPTPAAYAAWCKTHIQKLKELLRLNPRLADRPCNVSGAFVRTAGEHGLRMNVDDALGEGELFPTCVNWLDTDPFKAIDLLARCLEWAQKEIKAPSTNAMDNAVAEPSDDTRKQRGLGEGTKPRETKKPFEKSNPKKANVYNRILAERRRGKKPAAIFAALKNDKDFKELLHEAGDLRFNKGLIHAALAWGNDPKRKNQESPRA